MDDNVDIPYSSASDLLEYFRSGDLSPLEVVRHLVERIATKDTCNSLMAIDVDDVLRQADAASTAWRSGHALPLLGVPVLVKDIIDTADLPTTYGSRMFRDHRPTLDARVVTRLRAAGAIVLAKTHTFEFAWGITSENEFVGPCRNPWNTERTTGGSSCGSAAATALGLAPLALGSDTAGSIRIPAAFCGVVGFRPTLGRVSTTGVFPLARSYDSVGLIARDADDILRTLQVIDGPDPTDILTESGSIDTTSWAPGRRDRPLTLGVVEIPGAPPPTPAIAAAFDHGLTRLVELTGARLVTVRLPSAESLLSTFGTIQAIEAHAIHAGRGLFPARGAEYGTAVAERLRRAASLTIEDYLAARERRREIQVAVRRGFDQVDMLVDLVSPCSPPSIATEGSSMDDADRFRAAVLPHTVVQPLAALPVCATPIGFDEQGLPVSMQISGAPGCDLDVLRLVSRLRPDVPVRPGQPAAGSGISHS